MNDTMLHHFTAHEGNYETTLMLINEKNFDPALGDR